MGKMVFWTMLHIFHQLLPNVQTWTEIVPVPVLCFLFKNTLFLERLPKCSTFRGKGKGPSHKCQLWGNSHKADRGCWHHASIRFPPLSCAHTDMRLTGQCLHPENEQRMGTGEQGKKRKDKSYWEQKVLNISLHLAHCGWKQISPLLSPWLLQRKQNNNPFAFFRNPSRFYTLDQSSFRNLVHIIVLVNTYKFKQHSLYVNFNPKVSVKSRTVSYTLFSIPLAETCFCFWLMDVTWS